MTKRSKLGSQVSDVLGPGVGECKEEMKSIERVASVELEVVVGFDEFIQYSFIEVGIVILKVSRFFLSLNLGQSSQRLRDIVIAVKLENDLTDPPCLLLSAYQPAHQL